MKTIVTKVDTSDESSCDISGNESDTGLTIVVNEEKPLAGPCSQCHPVRGPATPYRPDRLEETRYCWPLLPAQGASCQPARVMGANPRQAEAGETCYHLLKHPTG